MKLIDRYILRTFFVPFVYCLTAFCLLFVLMDLKDNIQEFTKASTPIGSILLFYVFLLPSLLVYIFPVSLMLAVLYSLAQLTRHNEITAMRAGGINFYRIVLPLVIVGMASSLLVSGINETVGAKSSFWSHQFVNLQDHMGDESVLQVGNLGHNNVRENRLWLIKRFHTKTYRMTGIECIQQRTNGADQVKYTAERGAWLDGRWWFYNVKIQPYNERGDPVRAPDFKAYREMSEFSETPETFLIEAKLLEIEDHPELLSTFEILKCLRYSDLAEQSTARLMVDFHHRLAMPWACLVVTMIGIPFGATTARRGSFLGVVLTLGLFFGYYAIMTVGLAMGKQMTLPPAVAAWLPNLLFLGLALLLIRRLR